MSKTKSLILFQYTDGDELHFQELYHSADCPIILKSADQSHSSQCTSCVKKFRNLESARKTYADKVKNQPLKKLQPNSGKDRLRLTIIQKRAQ